MDRSMRVAFLSEHASPAGLLGGVDAGGQNVYVDEVSRNLGRLGVQVDVFTRWESPDAPEVLAWAPNVRIVNLQVGPPRWVLKDHLWPLMPAFREEVMRFMLRDGVRYGLVHGNFWMSGWVAVSMAERLRVPSVHIFHALGKTKRREQGEADTSPRERIGVEEDIVRRVDRLIAQCPSERSELLQDYGAQGSKVVVIPSAVNVERFRPVDRLEARRALGLSPDERIVAYVGRMLPRKDVRNVVRATQILARAGRVPVRLLAVGGETEDPDPRATPEIGELQRLIAELDVADRVTLVGKRQPDELYLYYGAADVAVTTPWYEPFGLTPLEAMACARPVVGSAVGGIRYTVEDGVTGFLVPPRDPEALAARLEQILGAPTLGETMGRAARMRVEAQFTWPLVARRTAEVYHGLIEEREAQPSGRRPPAATPGRGSRG